TGGIAGLMFGSNSKVLRCGFSGTVTGLSRVGGVAGVMDGTNLIAESYAAGVITGLDEYVGGITGRIFGATMVDCYSRCQVQGPTFVGGVSGNIDASGVMQRCYGAGPVNVGLGGSGGLLNGTIQAGGATLACYFDNSMSGPAGEGGSARSTAEMTFPY